MKPVFVSASRWHGTDNAEGRGEGVILQIGTHSISGTIIEVELSYEEWGKVLAGIGGKGTSK